MRDYLIKSSSETCESQLQIDIFNKYFETNAKNFTKEGDFITFSIEITSHEAYEEDLKNIALALADIHDLSEIQIWKKSSNHQASGSYDIGIAFIGEDDMELLLGLWEDWTFNRGLKEYAEKDATIKKMNENRKTN